jgi:CDP-diacylglycerol--glycerol-3-phosphate 3-phosphatidyltransferase
MASFGMDAALVEQIIAGQVEDANHLRWNIHGMFWAGQIGLWLLWIAAALTLITGYDYLRKAMPHLKEI